MLIRGFGMEIFVLEKLNTEQNNMLQKRVRILEKQVVRLKDICTELYKMHCYHLQDLDDEKKRIWEEARKCCAKIENNSWNEAKDTLNLYKAQAFCYLGTVYKEQGDYDEALKYLNRARNLIEELSAMCLLPECYAKACIGSAICYMEKHSSSCIIDECLSCAKETIQDIDEESERFRILSLELLLQEAIAKMDTYGVNAGRNINVRILEAWPIIEKADFVMEQLFNEETADSLDKEWKKKVQATLLTTKADYFKKIYFKLKDDDFYQKTNGLLKQLPDINMAGCGEKRTYIQKYYFENAFYYFAKTIKADSRNTMGMSNIAALLYDHYQSKADENYLFGLLKNHFKECDTFFKTSILEVINQFLDKTLDIEYNNIFALNMKAVLSKDNKVSSTINHYQTLRQSFLKRRFKNFKAAVGDVCSGELRNIMINLIILHCKVSEFMDSAIIDFNDPQWKELKVGHYTRLEVLPKLINRDPNSRMRIQNVHHLNDPLEGVLFVNLLGKMFGEKGYEEESVIKELLDLYGSEKNGTVRNSVYMGSFTSRLDDLNMWARYGDGGKGCSLQLDAAKSFDNSARISLEELFADESEYSYKMEDTQYPLYMVLYLPLKDTENLKKVKEYAMNRAAMSKQEQPWWEKQRELIEKLENLEVYIEYTIKKIDADFAKICENLDTNLCKKAKRELCNIIIVILDLVRFLIKSDYYCGEREYRIIQYSSNPQYDDTGREMPKLYIPVEKELKYDKICFGPLVNNFDSQAAYVLNIKQEKKAGEPRKTWNLEVCKSDINYR